MMKVLLLGGTGTISKAVLYESLRKGWNVSILNRGSQNRGLSKDVSVFVADIHNEEQVYRVLGDETFDVIVDFLSRNPCDITNVFPLMSTKCKQYVFISTCCVYERNDDDFPIKEYSSKPNKQWSYNVEKYNAEQELMNLARNATCVYTIVRPYITYDERRIPYGLAPAYDKHRTLIERIKNRKPLLLWNGGDNIITITQSTDFARFLVGLFMNKKAFNEDFNLVSDYQYSYKEIVEKFCKKIGFSPCWVNVNVADIIKYMPEDRQLMVGDRVLDAIFDNSKIKEAVPNVKFECSLEKGLDIIIDHYNHSEDYHYDYKYDALIDKVASHVGKRKYGYFRYNGAQNTSFIEYYLYRYFPYKIANKIRKLIAL